ncbi:hypothetical protein EK21DRAFT_111390 [Setomelanomma holmii]|uniref:Tafazzin n=1 Tax=Setomelanomma holmii TaxID=210430 RepID=A0A9P4HCP4_9PLEO|nr:hypothetical protein EK21DRAFT_111390 [Setomelanomma holmii]
MPKKHTPAYTTTKPNYVHPSLQGSRAAASATTSEPQTVNQRIAQLRREQAPRATIEQRNEITSVVSSRTVPPDLRRILHIPEVNAPKPKAGTRMRTRLPGGARPPPGPAAPSSWLHTSRHAPKYVRDHRTTKSGERASLRCSHLAEVTEDDFKRLPPPRSLQHHCLRTFAEHWIELSEYEQHYLPTVPIVLREALLSYLTIYGGDKCLDLKSFKILFQSGGDSISDWEEVRFLDVTGLLNEDFTINDLGKSLKRVLGQVPEDLEALSISDTSPKGKSKAKMEVVDSWEEEVDDPAITDSILPAQLTTPHFSNLGRLSLAHPGAWASWPDLLKLSPSLNKITHLSLAYWPRPTLTPNATTTSMVSNYARVSLGGTPFYSDLDDDWHEATNILRRFSANTYSLQWLDLEGCQWIRALTWRSDNSNDPSTATAHAADSWSITASIPGPDWTDAWRRITYLHLFQGWIPADKKSLQNMPAGLVPVQLMRWLRENAGNEHVTWKLNKQERGYMVTEWVDREKVARQVGMEIQSRRRSMGGGWCKVDHGWGGDGEKGA